MSRPQAPDASDSAPDELLDAAASEPGRAATVDLASLPIVGLTRRRMALIVGALLAVWILITFARQVAEASESVTRAEDIATGNAVIRLEVAAM